MLGNTHLLHIPNCADSILRTIQIVLIPKWAYYKKGIFQQRHIPKRAHSKKGTFQKGHIPKKAHSKKSTFQKGLIPEEAHSWKSTFLKGNIPKKAHSQKLTTLLYSPTLLDWSRPRARRTKTLNSIRFFSICATHKKIHRFPPFYTRSSL